MVLGVPLCPGLPQCNLGPLLCCGQNDCLRRLMGNPRLTQRGGLVWEMLRVFPPVPETVGLGGGGHSDSFSLEGLPPGTTLALVGGIVSLGLDKHKLILLISSSIITLHPFCIFMRIPLGH